VRYSFPPSAPSIDALGTTKEMFAFTVFERAFKDSGLPLSIRTDNGVPFASPSAFFGLSKLYQGNRGEDLVGRQPMSSGESESHVAFSPRMQPF
jgi:hypothetical protein